MKNLPSSVRQASLGLLAGLAVHSAVHAQQFDSPEPAGWYFRAGAAARFNTKATITGSLPTLPTGNYDDGFVRPDRGGTASGKTWNWGYDNSGQIQGDSLVLRRLDGVPTFGAHDINTPDPNLNYEVIAGYEFADFEVGKRRKVRLNFELGYGFSSFKQSMGFGAAGTVTQTTDSYGLGGIVPPLPPYAGTFNGPGPLIDLNYSSHVIDLSPATTAFAGSLDTTMHEFRAGAAFATDLTKRLSLSVGAGYSSIYADARLKYTETTVFSNVAVPSPAPVNSTLSKRAWLPGLYLEFLANYSITDHIGVFIGGDLHHNQSLKAFDTGHALVLDMGITYAVKGGLSLKF